MGGTVLVRDVLWRASVLLGDAAPQYARYAEADMVDALNDAQVAFCSLPTGAGARIGALRLKPGVLQSIATIAAGEFIAEGVTTSGPLQGLRLLGLHANMGSIGNAPGRAIRLLTSRSLLDSGSPNWQSESGSTVRGYLYDPATPTQFYVVPGAPAGGLWVRCGLVTLPARIPDGGAPGAPVYAKAGASSVTIGLADDFIDELVNYVVARMLMAVTESADAARASIFASAVVSALNGRMAGITGSSPNLKQLPFAPEPIGRAAA